MGEKNLQVFREIRGAYEPVGHLTPSAEGATFSYEESYLAEPGAHAISAVLPLREGEHDHAKTKAFFDGLLPEGPLRRSMSDAFHMSVEDYQGLLSRLNNESAGALVFCEDGQDPMAGRGYDPLPTDELARFAHQPRSGALNMNVAARLSLAGAQAKVGLHHEGNELTSGWLFPRGSAPSTYIVKAVDGTFPYQTVNEALCLKTAGHLDFDVSNVSLLAIPDAEPLLMIRRFDRVCHEGQRFPWRRHQEDFCQATGVSSTFKYEPTDGHYISRISTHIAEESANPFGDRVLLFSRLLFDWAVGNCDNHLKNHSLLWDEGWNACELSPFYDVTCTTFYESLDREMGVSLCPSRKIDDVTLTDLLNSAREAGVPRDVALSEIRSLGENFLPALRSSCEELLADGFDAARQIAEHIRAEFEARFEPVATELP